MMDRTVTLLLLRALRLHDEEVQVIIFTRIFLTSEGSR